MARRWRDGAGRWLAGPERPITEDDRERVARMHWAAGEALVRARASGEDVAEHKAALVLMAEQQRDIEDAAAAQRGDT